MVEILRRCQSSPRLWKSPTTPTSPSAGTATRKTSRGEGLAHNFKLVEKRLGATTHVHDLAGNSYPYAELFALLKAADYEGWLLEEASTSPRDRVAALAKEREAFDALLR